MAEAAIANGGGGGEARQGRKDILKVERRSALVGASLSWLDAVVVELPCRGRSGVEESYVLAGDIGWGGSIVFEDESLAATRTESRQLIGRHDD